jgi:hypothetical protein
MKEQKVRKRTFILFHAYKACMTWWIKQEESGYSPASFVAAINVPPKFGILLAFLMLLVVCFPG